MKGGRGDLLLDVTRSTSVHQRLDDVLRALAELAAEHAKAELASVLLLDRATGDLHFHATNTDSTPQMLVAPRQGIAGRTAASGEAIVINDCYADPRFDPRVDVATGLHTTNLVSVPIEDVQGTTIGVLQVVNHLEGRFDDDVVTLLADISTQASAAITSAAVIEELRERGETERSALALVGELAGMLELDQLLDRVVNEMAELLGTERATVFLYDRATEELYSVAGGGLDEVEIRFGVEEGLAGEAFLTGQSLMVDHTYGDPRFNAEPDAKSGFFTRSVLVMPIEGADAEPIGVAEAINKRGGPFTAEDERRLRAFTSELAACLDKARLFELLSRARRYSDAILESISAGVLTIDADGVVVSCNRSAQQILRCGVPDGAMSLASAVGRDNPWLLFAAARVDDRREIVDLPESELLIDGETRVVDIRIQPLLAEGDENPLGLLFTLDDRTDERRTRATLGRYVDGAIVDELLAHPDATLGGKEYEATVIFCDIVGFTALSERLGPQETVGLLNGFFTRMVECVRRHGGVVDKFVGDAMMVTFGIPTPSGDEADRALDAADEMLAAFNSWRRDRVSHGEPAVEIGIGVASGRVVAGNIGAPRRMDFTVIGSGVNEAARLESACRQVGARVLVHESTVRAARRDHPIRSLGAFKLRGVHKPIEVHELVRFDDGDNVSWLFEEALSHVAAFEFDEAAEALRTLLVQRPEDHVATHLLEQCAGEGGRDWIQNGVWTLDGK